MNSYDIVGDVHGHADELQALLRKLGYTPSGPGFKPPAGRQLILVGDLIDRGPGQLRALEIARAMIDAGDARCVMGNHEFNAIGYVMPDPRNPGDFLRPNRGDAVVSRKNVAQHAAFIAQVGEGSATHHEWVRWFRTLPLFLDLGGIRVAHASWHDPSIDLIKAAADNRDAPMMSDGFFDQCHIEGSPLESARLRLTCGLEWPLPPGMFILDKAGHRHFDMRIADWRFRARRLREIALVPNGNEDAVPDIEIPDEVMPMPITGAPIFVGHHWFSGEPTIEYDKHLCLDWSIAREGGRLVAYRWDGEETLQASGLVWVERY